MLSTAAFPSQPDNYCQLVFTSIRIWPFHFGPDISGSIVLSGDFILQTQYPLNTKPAQNTCQYSNVNKWLVLLVTKPDSADFNDLL